MLSRIFSGFPSFKTAPLAPGLCAFGIWGIALAFSGCTAISDFSVHDCNVDADCDTLNGGIQRCERGQCIAGCTNNRHCSLVDPRFPICSAVGAQCVDLTSDDGACYASSGYVDQTMGELTGAQLALVGAFAPALKSSNWLSMQLAADEINADGGLPLGTGPNRPLVLLACDDRVESIEPAMKHLVNQLGARALLGTLEEESLSAALSVGATRNSAIFLTPSSVDATASAEDVDAVWALGTRTTELAGFYPDVVQLVARVADARRTDLHSLRLLSVIDQAQEDDTLAEAVLPSLVLDGSGTAELLREDRSRTLRLSDDSPTDRAQKLADAAAFAPDIVLLFVGGTFASPRGKPRTTIVQDMENLSAASNGWRPLYVLGARNLEDSFLRELALHNDDYRRRVVGVTVARAADPQLAQPLQARFAAAFPQAESSSGLGVTSSVYDALYFLAYALAAAPRDDGPLSTQDVRTGLQDVMMAGADRVDVGPGPDGLDKARVASRARTPFDTYGTNGPAGSVDPHLYCFNTHGDVEHVSPPAPGNLLTIDPGNAGDLLMNIACAVETPDASHQ